MNSIDIAKKINENNGNMYLVGGAVRDELMQKEIHDNDYCITGLTVEQFTKLFPNAKLVGNDFPVFLINGEEYALARSEEKASIGHKGFKMHTSPDITIEDDLKRRDITINAIAKNVLTNEIIDPFNGQEDLKNGIIRHVSNAFAEDPLRAYRVARFASKFNFNIHPETINLMNLLRNEISTLTPERVFLELRKALQTDKPSKFFIALKEANILDIHFKEIYDLIGVIQPPQYHPEGDCFNHSMIVLDKVSNQTFDTMVRFAGLVHDLGKGKTPKEILPHHYNHEKNGIEPINNLSKRIKLPKSWKKAGQNACQYHMLAKKYEEMRPYKLAVLFNKIDRSTLGLDNLQIITNADDMINKPKVDFASIAHEMLNTINGHTLIEKGLHPNIIGSEKFLHELLTQQSNFLEKNIQRKRQKQNRK